VYVHEMLHLIGTESHVITALSTAGMTVEITANICVQGPQFCFATIQSILANLANQRAH
jgi:hypothetical protein